MLGNWWIVQEIEGIWCVCFLSYPFLDRNVSLPLLYHDVEYAKHFFLCMIKETILFQIGGVILSIQLDCLPSTV